MNNTILAIIYLVPISLIIISRHILSIIFSSIIIKLLTIITFECLFYQTFFFLLCWVQHSFLNLQNSMNSIFNHPDSSFLDFSWGSFWCFSLQSLIWECQWIYFTEYDFLCFKNLLQFINLHFFNNFFLFNCNN